MAKLNKSALETQIADKLADNTTGSITASDLRSVTTDIIDSVGFNVSAGGEGSVGYVFVPFASGITLVAGDFITTGLADPDSQAGSGVITINCILNAGNGIAINAGDGTITPDLLTSGGLVISSNKIAVNPDDFVGSGLANDGFPDTGKLRLDINNLPSDANAGNAADSVAIADASDSSHPKKITISQLGDLIADTGSGNAFKTISAGGDAGYTWTSQNDIVSEGDADSLFIIAGTGIRLDTDATNDAVRFSVSGSLPLATHPSISAASSSLNANNTFIQDITVDAYGHITAIDTNTIPSGNYHPIIDSSNRLDASLIGSNGDVSNAEFGYLSNVSSDIQAQLDANSFNLASGNLIQTNITNIATNTSNIATKGSGTMSRLKVGASDGLPQLQQLGDGSGLFFAAGSNMTITLTNNDAGSGILTFASSAEGGGTATSGNAFTTVSAGGDTGYTWTSHNDVVAVNDADTLKLVAGSGIRLDTDASSKAIRFSASGDYATVASPTFTGTITIGSAEISETELEILDGATLSTTELNYVDGVTSAIQTQLDAKGSGTMSRLKIGASDGLPQLQQLGDGSGIFFAAGDNVSVTLTNSDAGSGVVTIASSHPSISAASSSNNSGNTFIQDITVDSNGHITGIGTNTVPSGNYHPIIDTSNRLDATLIGANGNVSNTEFGYLSSVSSDIQAQIDSKGSGTMSRLKIGASDGLPQLQQLADGSGLFFAAGSNMSITLTNSDAGSGILTFASDVSTNNPTFTGNITIGSAEISETELEILDGATLSTTELNYVDGVTSAIQTQLDSKGSGTMSKFHIGSTTQVDPNQISIGDGSGLFFAAGDNMTITTTNTDGSGVVTFASTASGGSARSVAGDTDNGLITWVTSDNTFAAESNLTYDGTTLKVAGLQGNNPGVPFIESDGIIYGSGISTGASGLRIAGVAVTSTAAELNILDGVTADANELNLLDGVTATTTELNYVDGVTSAIQTQLDAKGSGTMSRLKIGASDGLPQLQQLGDGSGIFFAAGDNVSVTLTNSDAGSGIVTIASAHPSISAASTSDNGGNTFIQDITLDGNGHVTGIGTNTIPSGNYHPVIDASNRLDASLIGANGNVSNTEYGYLASVSSDIQTQLDAKGSGTMSRLKIGASDGLPQLQQLGDGSGLFFAAGDNMTIALTNNDAGSGIITFSSAVPVNNPTFTGNITIGSAEISETELEILDGATLTTTELNYVDGVTSAIQTQLDAKGSGTMSRLKVGASDGLPQLQQLGDGSGLFFAAGSNMSVTLTNNDAGSGILTFASDVSTNNPTFTGNITIGSAEISETELEILDGATLTTTELNYVDGVTSAIQTQLDAKGSGTMSRLKIGASDGLPQLQQLGDGSGIFFAGGDNMTVTLTNSDAGSGILTFASAVSTNNPTFTGNITIGSAEISETELEILDGATLTTTELNYVDGVTSAIQTQLDAKAAVASPTFTGVVTTPRLVVTALAGNTGGVPHIDSDGIIYGSGVSAGPSGLRINGTAITATPAELNLIDGGATVGTTAVADGDGIIHNDDGTMRVTTVQTFDTYFAQTTKTLTNKTLTSPTITSPTITGTTTLASGVTIGLQANDTSDGYSLEVAGQIGASGVVVAPITASDGATVTFDLKRSSFHMVTLGGNRTLAVEDAKVGQKFIVRLQQDGAGSRTVTWFNGIRWAGGGTAPTLTTTANQADSFGFIATSGTTDFDGFIIGQNI